MIAFGRSRLSSTMVRVGFACALAAAFAPLSSYVHEATVPHYFCPEHGEAMDAPPLDPDEEPALTAPSHTRISRNSRPRSTEHRHCPLVPQRLQPVTRACAHLMVANLRQVASDRAAAPGSQPRATRLILLAPKTSPPA